MKISFTFLRNGRIALTDTSDLASFLSPKKHSDDLAEWRSRFERLGGSPLFAVIRQDAVPGGTWTAKTPRDLRSPQLAEEVVALKQPEAHHPEVDTGVHLMMVLDMAARLDTNLAARFACLGHDLGKGTTPADVLPRHLGHEQRSVDLVRSVCDRLRVPVACRELAEVVAREHGNIHRSGEFDAAAIQRLLDRCDAWRRPERFADALLACECDARGRLGMEDDPYPQRPRLLTALAAPQAIDAAAIAARAVERGLNGPAIGAAVNEARANAIAAVI